ncbi:MAG: MerR family transcriptional regulator [Gammaproteobacteria bacterium]|nr:MerR family transcriptional regulator [Gammaproteobacteria bacterium]
MKNHMIVRAADMECETGLSNDLIRKWRSRYGFPTIVQLPDGAYGYASEQIAQLRQIKRLLDGGLRPGQIVGKSIEQLDQLIASFGCSKANVTENAATREAIERLRVNDIQGLNRLLEGERARQSLTDFIEQTIAPLTVGLGDAWVLGEIEVYQEHLGTGCLLGMLFREIGNLSPKPGFPRIVFSTPSEELHVLGLLMAQAVLADGGADCIYLGPHTPLGDLNMAAQACQADIVALSISSSYPRHRTRPFIAQLREVLPGSIEIWAGGAGAGEIKRAPDGVRVFSDLREAANALMERVGKVSAPTPGYP